MIGTSNSNPLDRRNSLAHPRNARFGIRDNQAGIVSSELKVKL